MVKKEVITLIREFLRRLFQEGIIIDKAYLYGSWASGKENQDSDIDVMLISEMYDNNDDRVVGKTWRISRSVDVRIEPYTVGKKRFLSDKFSPLLQVVKQEGLEIEAWA
jgi:predicted nucleotidyltransferase